MILILSSRNDASSDYVIEWMNYLNLPFIRLNEGDSVNILSSIEFKDGQQEIIFRIKGEDIRLTAISAVWFRRGNIDFASSFFEYSMSDDHIKRQIMSLLKREHDTLISFLISELTAIKSLNSQQQYNSNKLIALMNAQKAGLKVPHTIVTTELEKLQLIGECDDVITKPIQDIFWLKDNGSSQAQYTAPLSDYGFLPDRFYYSLFQRKVKKKYELRIFFIETEFYACAIFNDAADGRDLLAGNKLARMVPYCLPDSLRNQLVCLNALNGLNCGSIDMLVDVNNDFFFLEVNPVGQYDYISRCCNYHLDRKIAEYFL